MQFLLHAHKGQGLKEMPFIVMRIKENFVNSPFNCMQISKKGESA